MKRLATMLIIICSMFISLNVSAAMILEYDGSVHNYTGSVYALEVNYKELNNLPLEPIIFNNRAVVPAREVFEALGATVDYEAKTKEITIKYGQKKVVITIDSNIAYVNSEKKKIPDGLTPKLIAKWGESAKTMVPVRFISESVGLVVTFDSVKGKIGVAEANYTPDNNSTEKPDTNTNTNTGTQTSTTTQNVITAVSAKESDDVVTITVTAKNNITKMTDASVTSSGVLFVDVPNMTYTAANKTIVNDEGVVKSVRLGIHDNSTRIAIDTNGMQKHNVSISGKSIIFKISSNKNADLTIASNTTTNTSETGTNTTTNNSSSSTPEEPTVPLVNGKTPSELSGGVKYVVLDAGHGGSDPGAIGNLMNDQELEEYHKALLDTQSTLDTMVAGTGGVINEKDITLSVTKKVKAKLEAQGINVILTRSKDTYPTLDERPQLANSKGAAMFLSIHVNSTVNPVTSASGMEIFYSESNNNNLYGVTSKTLASAILKSATNETKASSRGVKAGNLLVTRKSVMPASLIEIGFINNPDEVTKLIADEYQEKIANGIAKGIAEVLGKITLP